MKETADNIMTVDMIKMRKTRIVDCNKRSTSVLLNDIMQCFCFNFHVRAAEGLIEWRPFCPLCDLRRVVTTKNQLPNVLVRTIVLRGTENGIERGST